MRQSPEDSLMLTGFALAFASLAGQDPVLGPEEALTLELVADQPQGVALALAGRPGFIRVECADCDISAGLEDGELLDLDLGPGFDELLEVDGSESRIVVAGAGGTVVLLWVPPSEGQVDVRAEIDGFARFLSGAAPVHQKRVALGEVFLLGREARDSASGAHLEELITALQKAVLAGNDHSLGLRIQELLKKYLLDVGGDPVSARDWVYAHVLAAKEFQWLGEYQSANRILGATGDRGAEVGGLVAVEYYLLLADTDVHLGRHERAGRHCDRLASLLAEVDLGKRHLEAMSQLAGIRFRLGQYSAARTLMVNGFALAEREGRSPSPLWKTGALIDGRENRHAEAAQKWGELIDLGHDPLSEAGYRVNRGRALRELGNPDGARSDFQRALELAREGNYRHIEAAAGEGMARLHLAGGDITRARQEIEAAIQIERQDGLSDYLAHSLQTLALVSLEEGEPASARLAMQEAEALLAPTGLSPRGLSELRSRYSFWSAIGQDIVAFERELAGPEERAALAREGLWLAGQWSGRAMLSAMRAREGGGLELSAEGLIEAVAPGLGPERALVCFAAGAQVLRAYVVHAGEVHVVELADLASIEASAARYLREVCCSRPTKWAPADVARIGHEVFERTLEPVLEKLPDSVEALVVVPSETLAGLPFEALVTSEAPEGETTFDALRYLVERYAVTYAPSVPIFAHLTGLPPRVGGQRALFLGDTTVPSEWGGLPASHRLSGEVNDVWALRLTRDEVVRLALERIPRERRAPHCERHFLLLEPDAARDGRWTTEWFDLYLGADAGPAVLAADLGVYDRIHVACHSFDDPQDPAHRGLVLSGAAGDDDGLMDLGDIRACEMNASLVVLAGCETGSGQVMGGEGVQSIAGAFLEAGARSVVASLWPVEDGSTKLLMIQLEQNCGQGLSAPLALEAAKRAVWTRPLGRGVGVGVGQTGAAQRLDPRHPYSWAPFIYIGRL